ncbi:hypothetical protein ACTSKR_06605 [Chitinibacteraceae bacterium HSL-7]
MKRAGMALVVLALVLTGCDQVGESVQRKIDETVDKTTNAALDQLASEANKVIGNIDASGIVAAIDASGVSQKLKQKADALKQSLAGSDWQRLNDFTGQYPRDIGLLSDVSPIMPELKSVLGSKLDVLRANLAVQSPLQNERVLYVTGNKQHEGGFEAAYLLIDTEQRKVEVGLIERGVLTVYQSAGARLYRPADVETLVANLGGKRA